MRLLLVPYRGRWEVQASLEHLQTAERSWDKWVAENAVNLEGVAYGRVHGFFSKQSPGLYLPSPRRSRHACERGI